MNPDALDTAAVGAFLSAGGVEIEGELSSRLIAGGRSNLTYAMSDAFNTWVVRRPPKGGMTPSAHDMTREFRVTRALQETGVPVAKAVVLCEDESVIGAPFTVVEFVSGRTIRTQEDLGAFSDGEIKSCVNGLVSVFAQLHAVDHEAIGLSGFGRPDSYAARQLRRWSGQWKHVAKTSTGQAERLCRFLEDSVPGQRHTSIVHGDFRIDNTIIAHDDAARIEAIVDWELSTIGDPVADVAMMCAYRHPAFDLALGMSAAWTSSRLPSAEDLAGIYESTGEIALDHWEFHMGLAYYKLAVIVKGIDHRYRLGATIGDGFDTAGEAVEIFLQAGLEAVGAS